MRYRAVQDTRIGGITDRYVLLDEGEALMQVPDEVRECVGFVYYKRAGKIRPAGTCFFVAYPYENPERTGWGYTITARHLINLVRARSDDGLVILRLNAKHQPFGYITAHVDKWWLHPIDENADVAVLAWAPSKSGEFNAMWYPMKPGGSITDPEVIAREQMGVGEDTFITGLFVNHAGQSKNEPIIRVGTIAAMPEDRVETMLGPAHVFLVELRSIGGLSGSPAFWHPGLTRHIEGEVKFAQTKDHGGAHYLMGVTQGHWDIEVGTSPAQAEAVNMGIGIVTPIEKVVDVLERDELRAGRALAEIAKKAEAAQEDGQAVVDSDVGFPAVDSYEEETDALTEGGFMGALHRATRLIPPAESAPEG